MTFKFQSAEIDVNQMFGFIRRMELATSIFRRLEEELIAAIVPIPQEYIEKKVQDVLGETPEKEFLYSRGWSQADLKLHVCHQEALNMFAEQRFGPGLEEQFLASRGAYDQIIYSLLRVRDASLARELWIRIEESETTFSDAAQSFGQGPEAQRKGIIGPMPIGQLSPPLIADLLRGLSPGKISPPTSVGEWHIILRLEQLTPARFDSSMRSMLLNQSLDKFLSERVTKRLSGDHLEPLTFDLVS